MQFPKLLCLHVGRPGRNIHFPLEVGELQWPQKTNNKLTDREAATMIRASAVDAMQRKKRILGLFQQADFQDDPFLKTFGVNVSTEMVQTVGRVLTPPAILYRENKRCDPIILPCDGAWSMDNQQVYPPAKCCSYSLIGMVNPREQGPFAPFHLQATKMDMEFAQWARARHIRQRSRRDPRCVRGGGGELQERGQDLRPHHGRHAGKNLDVYGAVKECSDTIFGIRSQCVLLKTAQHPGPATCANLALKINIKRGGINSRVIADSVTQKYLVEQPTLVSASTLRIPRSWRRSRECHRSRPQIVSNHDCMHQRDGSYVKVQRKCRESVVFLVDAVRDRLLSFTNGQKPSRIFVYRDCVSEGKFQEFLHEELLGIKMACSMVSADYKPHVTFIVVQKRHHVRLFCKNPTDASRRAKNCVLLKTAQRLGPATCATLALQINIKLGGISSGIVSQEGFDFYLCSHFGIQGTSHAARYHVMWDDSKFSSDEIQALTVRYVPCVRSLRSLGVDSRARLLRGPRRDACSLPHQVEDLLSGLLQVLAAAAALNSAKADDSERSDDEHTTFSLDELDSTLQKYVTVRHEFKARMYFI